MKKTAKIITALFITSILFVGCTAPTQPIADQAFQQALAKDDEIIKNLSDLAKWEIMTRTGNEAANIVSSTTQPAEKKAELVKNCVKDAVNSCEEVSYAQIAHERNRRAYMITDIYIKSNQGILNVWAKDLAKAKQAADVKASEVKKPVN